MKDMWKGLKHCDTAVDFWSLEWFWRSKGSKTGESRVIMGEITIRQPQVELNTQNHTPKGAPFYIASVKEECLAKLILLGEGSLRRALRHYEAHYHEERNHQGKNNVLLFPLPTQVWLSHISHI
jgi:hypothetical protein